MKTFITKAIAIIKIIIPFIKFGIEDYKKIKEELQK